MPTISGRKLRESNVTIEVTLRRDVDNEGDVGPIAVIATLGLTKTYTHNLIGAFVETHETEAHHASLDCDEATYTTRDDFVRQHETYPDGVDVFIESMTRDFKYMLTEALNVQREL